MYSLRASSPMYTASGLPATGLLKAALSCAMRPNAVLFLTTEVALYGSISVM